MAERSPARKRRADGDESDSGSEPGRKSQRRQSDSSSSSGRKSSGRLSGGQLAQRARQELADITGLDPEGVTSLERVDDGTWNVKIEMLELERVPSTDDVLGSYLAHLDENGELLGYERVERHTRSQTDSGQRADRGR